jgi:hypothetical protein
MQHLKQCLASRFKGRIYIYVGKGIKSASGQEDPGSKVKVFKEKLWRNNSIGRCMRKG